MMPVRVSRGERTQEEITRTAYRLFLERGYHGTSVRRIAQQAGIALGGIYNHFSCKEDIFAAVLEAYHPYHEILPAVEAAQGDTIEEFITSAAHGMVASLDQRPDFLNLMLIEIVEFNSVHIPPMVEKVLPQFSELLQNFLKKRGNLRPVPLPILLRAFIGLFFSYYITETLLGEQLRSTNQGDALEYFVDIFLHGVVQHERASQ